MNQKQTNVLIVLALALLSQGTCDSVCAKSKAPKAVKDSMQSNSLEQEEMAVRNVLIALEKSLSSKGEGAGQLFAENAVHIDQAGDEIRGRAALQARFDEQLKTSTAAIGIHPESITFPDEQRRSHCWAKLVATKKTNSCDYTFFHGAGKSKRFMVDQSSHRNSHASAQMESQLQQLDWLIGNWATDKSDSAAELKAEWSPQGKKFITSKYILNKTGSNPQIDSHIIGWDPQRRSIVSWHFDSNGGFGTGIWVKLPNENTWAVAVTGVGGDGSIISAENTFSLKSPDEFVWQSTHRSSDGIAVADTTPITVRRVKP